MSVWFDHGLLAHFNFKISDHLRVATEPKFQISTVDPTDPALSTIRVIPAAWARVGSDLRLALTMARPGQTASRKRRVVRADDSSYAGDSDDGGGGGGDGSYKGSQVLPVAELSDDWDGEILDGATYLGVARWAIHYLVVLTSLLSSSR